MKINDMSGWDMAERMGDQAEKLDGLRLIWALQERGYGDCEPSEVPEETWYHEMDMAMTGAV